MGGDEPQPAQAKKRPDLPPWQQADSGRLVATMRFSPRLASRSCGPVGPRLQWMLDTDCDGLCCHAWQGQVAVKAIDDRGNELLVVKSLEEAE